MNLFYVSSAFQYICAEEAQQHYQTKNDVLLLEVNPNHSHAKKQLEMVNKKKWLEVILFTQNQRSLQIPKIIKRLSKMYTLDIFFFAEYHSWLVNIIKKNISFNKHIYFDDGTLTLYEYENFIKNRATYRKRRLVQDLLLYIQGIIPPREVPYFDNLEIFTIFNIDSPSCTVTNNNLSYMRSSLPVKEAYHNKAPIGIIGQGAVGEKGHISIKKYINAIQKISEKHKAAIYFPHRSESEEVKNKVIELGNIIYHYSENPIELEIAKANLKLSRLYGLASTALYTLSIIYKEIPIYTFTTEEQETNKNLINIKNIQSHFNEIK